MHEANSSRVWSPIIQKKRPQAHFYIKILVLPMPRLVSDYQVVFIRWVMVTVIEVVVLPSRMDRMRWVNHPAQVPLLLGHICYSVVFFSWPVATISRMGPTMAMSVIPFWLMVASVGMVAISLSASQPDEIISSRFKYWKKLATSYCRYTDKQVGNSDLVALVSNIDNLIHTCGCHLGYPTSDAHLHCRFGSFCIHPVLIDSNLHEHKVYLENLFHSTLEDIQSDVWHIGLLSAGNMYPDTQAAIVSQTTPGYLIHPSWYNTRTESRSENS